MADLGDVERMVDDLERDAVEKSRRYQAMQAQVEQISITESVAGGAVSVTVGHNGLPTDIKMTDGVRRMNPDEIAANVMRALQKAQSKYPERMREIVAETVGDDSTTRHIVATADENFPPPPVEEPEVAPQRKLFEAEEEPPRRPPAAPRRPPGDDDDGDFSDESFLRRD
ncbi:YbaB/EbfC family nucleoid-associated protein [Amycolatopsis sp.]|uniref:YbaB/EbfC family nucleoid-associated protein n=1 Tax=Amycolatopsis sp. TaxID=37632 RepID=UPI002E01884C|nr:YbaB/EbfC family nucleoid-associated protein [Amycolatopsis sp.]